MRTTSDLAFGRKLRAQRERRGLTLDAVAESTKIKRSLLADLEQGDLSRWPDGIYRRAFIREYAKVIGLPPDAIVEESGANTAERAEERRSALPHARGDRGAPPMRLALADAPTPTVQCRVSRVVRAVSQLVLVLAAGYVASLITSSGYGTATAVVALIWYPTIAAIYGGPSVWAGLRAARYRSTPATAMRAVEPPSPRLAAAGENGDVQFPADPLVVAHPDDHRVTTASTTIH